MYKQVPLVSIIIPTYNRCNLIIKTIHSIIMQTFSSFELIIIDDGSVDNTEEVVRNISDIRVKYYKFENWGGPARPRNLGLHKSIGTYIAFCDDDDYWERDKLLKQINILNETHADFCFTGYNIIDNNNHLRKIDKLRIYQRNLSSSSFLFSFGFICNSSVLFKSSIIKSVGLFDEDTKLVAMEDYEYYYRIFRNFKPVYLSEVLVNYRNHNSQINKSSKRMWVRKQLYLNTYILNKYKPNIFLIAAKYVKIFFKYILIILGIQKV